MSLVSVMCSCRLMREASSLGRHCGGVWRSRARDSQPLQRSFGGADELLAGVDAISDLESEGVPLRDTTFLIKS